MYIVNRRRTPRPSGSIGGGGVRWWRVRRTTVSTHYVQCVAGVVGKRVGALCCPARRPCPAPTVVVLCGGGGGGVLKAKRVSRHCLTHNEGPAQWCSSCGRVSYDCVRVHADFCEPLQVFRVPIRPVRNNDKYCASGKT